MSKRLSSKAIKARIRNWSILRLRGAATLFTELNNQQGIDAVDYELRKLNAAPTESHEQAIWDKDGPS